MTQEEKQLLLKDLCARLPYRVIIQEYNEEYGYADNALNTIGIGYFSIHEACIEGTWMNHIENVRPYLRPMSYMTEEELGELFDCSNIDFNGEPKLVKRAMLAWEKGDKLLSNALFSMQYAKTIDWLNAHHFDYRGLIPMGLALEAPEGMYNTK